jgi:steroid delta-isomerase-like uncharacterized protein
MAKAGAQRIADAWATAWSSHDADKLLSLFADDCVYEDVTFGAVNRGLHELRAFAEAVFSAVPDFRIDLTTCFAAGNRAIMEWTLSGTHRGDLPGMPATGKQFSVRGVTVLELQTQKICRNSDYWDAASIMRQVGLLPPQVGAA